MAAELSLNELNHLWMIFWGRRGGRKTTNQPTVSSKRTEERREVIQQVCLFKDVFHTV